MRWLSRLIRLTIDPIKNIFLFLLPCLSLLFFPSPVFATQTASKNIIIISGLEAQPEALENVNARLSLLQQSQQAWQTTPSPSDLKHFYQQIPENIQKALQPFGYFHAQVIRDSQNANHFIIIPGSAVKIIAVDINITGAGKDNIALQRMIIKLKEKLLRPSDQFNTPRYQKIKQQLLTSALQEGYLAAYFEKQQILIHLKNNTCQIDLNLNTGSRYYFGILKFYPETLPLGSKFLTRYAYFKTGDIFSSQKLLDLQNALSGSQYFQNVAVKSPVEQAQNNRVPIKVHLKMQKRQQYLSGIGYGTDTGPRITLGADWRYVNSSGHAVQSQALLSPVQSLWQAAYVIPGKHPQTDKYALTSSVLENRLNQGESRTEQLGISSIKLFQNNWQRTMGLNYAIEQFKFSGQPSRTSYLFIPNTGFVNTMTDHKIFIRHGNKFLISMQGALQTPILSDTRFFQAEIQDKYITSFSKDNRFILRGDLGYTAVHDLDIFPLSLRFYTGGAQSIRGFSYQSLGPGRYLGTASVEFQQRVKHNWYGAVFADAGNALDHLSGNPQLIQKSAGIGIVWASPVGTMELTLAKVLSLPGNPVRLQFVLGPDL